MMIVYGDIYIYSLWWLYMVKYIAYIMIWWNHGEKKIEIHNRMMSSPWADVRVNGLVGDVTPIWSLWSQKIGRLNHKKRDVCWSNKTILVGYTRFFFFFFGIYSQFFWFRCLFSQKLVKIHIFLVSNCFSDPNLPWLNPNFRSKKK